MISVVLITHNYEKYIENCLDSILSNNNSFIGEIIIVNDSSKDNSEQIINKYLSNPKIKYFYVNFKSLSKSSESSNLVPIKKPVFEVLYPKFVSLSVS